MSRTLSLFICLAAVLLLPAGASAQDVLLDTFEDDTIGFPPLFPDVGFYSGSILGTASVINTSGGNKRFRCFDEATDGGCRLGYQSTAPLGRALTEYVFWIGEGATASGGPNDFNQQLILSPPGTNISIEWSAFIRQLGVRIFADGGETQFFIQGFQWAYDTDYFVEIETDADTDRYTLRIDGQEKAAGDIGVDLLSYDRITFSSGLATLGLFETDDVRVSMLPEPSGMVAVATVLGTLGLLIRHRR